MEELETNKPFKWSPKLEEIKRLSLIWIWKLLINNYKNFPSRYPADVLINFLPIWSPFMLLGGLNNRYLISWKKFDSRNARILYTLAWAWWTVMRVIISPQLLDEFSLSWIVDNTIFNPWIGMEYISSKAKTYLLALLSKWFAMVCMNTYIAKYEVPYIYKKITWKS
jgi:hypothetical protein